MTSRKPARSAPGRKPAPETGSRNPSEPAFVPPYPPSWVDRLSAVIDRLPGPFWAPYVVAFLAYLGVVGLIVWQGGRPLTPGAVFTNSLPFYGFWLIHYLNRRAAWSLEGFRPVFAGTERELQSVRWHLTTLPAGPTSAVSLAALLLAIASSPSWNLSSRDQIFGALAYYATALFAGLHAYHAIRQLRLVTTLYASQARVDLHNVAPLYSFSTLSAHTAIGMLLILSGAVLITPRELTGGFSVGAFLYGALAVLAFLLPLAGVHRRLVEAKEQELQENSTRWESSLAELYRRVDRHDWAGADRLNTILTGLERGRGAIERVPTWPWRPETFRGLLAALVLPVVLWLIQFGLQNLLG